MPHNPTLEKMVCDCIPSLKAENLRKWVEALEEWVETGVLLSPVWIHIGNTENGCLETGIVPKSLFQQQEYVSPIKHVAKAGYLQCH